MSQLNSASRCVSSFLENLDLIRRALAGQYPEFNALANVLRSVRAGELERRADVAGGFSYSVHGRGCLMVGPDGAEVDIDLLPDGHEAFDVWRLEMFARSVGMDPVPRRDDLLHECGELVRLGALAQPQPGWFSRRLG